MKVSDCLGKRVLINTNPNSTLMVMEYTVKEISPSGLYVNLENPCMMHNWYKITNIEVVEMID
jgi:hypothetical protein